MHNLVELWALLLQILSKKPLNNSDAVNDQAMWDYSALEIQNRDLKTDVLFGP